MRMADAIEACMSIELLHSTGASAPTLLTIAVGRSDPSRTVRTCAAKNAAQSQTKYPNTSESRLCHTELTSGKNGVGQHW